jgi:glycosyltransferase involved in cell wall biosynthesis
MIASSDRLRLLCVSHYFESHRGGIEMVAGRLARSLAARGVDVTWAATNASTAPGDMPVLSLSATNLIERRSGLPFPVLTLTGLARLVRAVRKHDVLLAHDGMYLTTIVAITVARLCRKPTVLVQHIGHVPARSLVLRALFRLADRLLTRPMLRLASQVVFISRSSAAHFANVRLRRDPMLIFNGVDTETFRNCRSARERIRERKQLGWDSRPVILFVGRFLEKKGLMRLREMAASRPELHWAFAGWGPCDPQAWNLANVSVYRDRSGQDLAALYRAADMLVLPSKSEGFPLVVQEALACGLHPVCCDDAAEADAAATPYLTGISNDGDEAEIVDRYLDAIDGLIAAPEVAQERFNRAAFACDRYSWEAAANRYCAIFSALRSRSAPDRRQQEVPA